MRPGLRPFWAFSGSVLECRLDDDPHYQGNDFGLDSAIRPAAVYAAAAGNPVGGDDTAGIDARDGSGGKPRRIAEPLGNLLRNMEHSKIGMRCPVSSGNTQKVVNPSDSVRDPSMGKSQCDAERQDGFDHSNSADRRTSKIRCRKSNGEVIV